MHPIRGLDSTPIAPSERGRLISLGLQFSNLLIYLRAGIAA